MIVAELLTRLMDFDQSKEIRVSDEFAASYKIQSIEFSDAKNSYLVNCQWTLEEEDEKETLE